jgi:hypothetical protein
MTSYHNQIQSQCMTLSGRGQVTALPDLAVLRLGVRTESTNLSEAQSRNAEISQAVLEGLQQRGIGDIRTYQYLIDQLYDFENGTRIDRGYTVSNILEIRTDQLNMVGTLIDEAVARGANVVDLISFELADPDFYYQQALNLAIMNAIEKARAINLSLGFHQDPQLIVIAENSMTPVPFRQAFAARGELAATPIEPGRQQIEAQVTAEFINPLA